MITGYNTDVSHSNVVFHVQTEDKGVEVASIESLVYVGGQILGKRSSTYRELLGKADSKESIVELMDRQHRLMIAEIRSGKYDHQLSGLQAPTASAARVAAEVPPTPASAAAASTAAGGVQETEEVQTLDQIILEYLTAEAEQEHLVLMMDVDREFALGQPANLQFRTKGSISGEPVPSTRIHVRMISTVAEPVTLARGETDAKGELGLSLQIPNLERGSSALIVTATSEIGTAEIKHLLWAVVLTELEMTEIEGGIRAILNGEQKELVAGTTVAALVSQLGRDPRTVAVEYNGEILPRSQFDTKEIVDGDRIEVVHFVQGG